MSQGRVFLVDDHDAVLDMLRRVMRDIDVDVVGEARTGAEAVPAILAAQPDLVVLDLSMRDMSGFEIATALRAHGDRSRLLAFTGVTCLHAIDRLHEMRFDGAVSKMSRLQELLDGVVAVLGGKAYMCQLLGGIRREQRTDPGHPSRILTPREVEVLALVGQAKSNEEIAQTLGISALSVQSVRSKLIGKLGLQGSPQLVRYANEHGYAEFARISETSGERQPRAAD